MHPCIFTRFENGEYVAQKEFDLKIFNKKVKELVKEYNISFEKEVIIPGDDSLARDVFEAGFTLVLETGFHFVDINRRIFLTEEEIASSIKNSRGVVIIGEGKDSRLMYHRRIEDNNYPIIIAGFAGTPTPTQYYLESVLSYAVEPVVDAIDHGSITELYGAKVMSGSPLEAIATRVEARTVREALKRAGRPGLHMIGGESAFTAIGALAAMGEEHLRRSDGLLVPVLNEMKVSNDTLTKSYMFNEYGGHVVSLVDPILGGYAGGPEGTAICAVAEVLLSAVLYDASYFLIHPTHILFQATSVPECMWVQSIVGQALALETSYIAAGNVWPAGGAGTCQVIYELSANTIVNVVSGLHLLGVTCTAGHLPHSSGLEARIMGELARSVTGLKRNDANDIVLQLVKMYREYLKKPNIGLPFNELYDLKIIKPREKLLGVYKKALKKVEDVLGKNTFTLL